MRAIQGLDGGSMPSRHAHHRVSRRTFVGAAAGITLGAGLPWPSIASAASTLPKPTTAELVIGDITFHVVGFADGVDPSSLTDFTGFVGVADVQGKGTATNPNGSTDTDLLFDTDMRFMSGIYVGQDKRIHEGTFALV